MHNHVGIVYEKVTLSPPAVSFINPTIIFQKIYSVYSHFSVNFSILLYVFLPQISHESAPLDHHDQFILLVELCEPN